MFFDFDAKSIIKYLNIFRIVINKSNIRSIYSAQCVILCMNQMSPRVTGIKLIYTVNCVKSTCSQMSDWNIIKIDTRSP